MYAITLLAIMLAAAMPAGMIPLACLLEILLVVDYNMSEWRSFLSALEGNRYDAMVLFVTFLLTVVFDLVLAIEVGMVLAAFLFMKRMSDITDLKPVLGTANGEEQFFDAEVATLPKRVLLFEITGPLFFCAAQKFQDVLGEITARHRVVTLWMHNVPLIDAAGTHRLKAIVKQLHAQRHKVSLTDVDPCVREELAGQDWLQPGLLQPTLAEAIAAAGEA